MDDRYEVWVSYQQIRTFPTLAAARDLFDSRACSNCLLHGGTEALHCAVYDRETDRLVRLVKIHRGNDIIFAAYATACEACGTDWFDVDMTDTLCVGCRVRVAA